MKVLILRTFAHTRIWESDKIQCTFEITQLENMIYSWEPDYSNFLIDNFRFALGIYTDKYFSFNIPPLYTPAYQNTNEEQIISLLKLRPYGGTSKFTNVLDRGTIQVFYNFMFKLWNDPSKVLMSQIDNSLIQEKKLELKSIYGDVPNTKFDPLSFSLEENSVLKILENNNIVIDVNRI